MNPRTVWITGLGAVTAAGAGAPILGERMRAGKTALRLVEQSGQHWAGVAPDLLPAGRARRLDRAARMFIAAAEEAWMDASLEATELAPERCGIIEGSSLGPLSEVLSAHTTRLGESSKRNRVPPGAVLTFMTGAGGASFAQSKGLEGPVLHLSAGSVSSACAIGDAYERIARGDLDLIVAGGAECPLHPEIVETFRVAGILAKGTPDDPGCRPFDLRRSGTVLGEGAGVLVLEAEEHARARGAVCRSRLTGFGTAIERHSMVAPDPLGSGVTRAARRALERFDGSPAPPVDWVKMHGTGTKRNDEAECRGLFALWPDRFRSIPITSLKPILGHCLGASAAVEAVAAVLALQNGSIPPLLGCERPDPGLPACRLARAGESCDAHAVLLLSESFGGRCSALLLER
jgi:3-oxoacyl-[acyl-carrier-protein] synthase II